MTESRIRAVLFDLGETLLRFDKVDVINVYREAAHHSCEYLKGLGQPVDNFRAYLWKNILGMRWKLFISSITGNDFDSLEVLKKYGRKRGIDITDEQWEEVNWSWYEPLSKRASFEVDLGETLEKLKQAGLKLGILSNTFVNKCSLERHLAQEGVLDFFQVRVYSYHYTFRKPDRRIFDEAARQIDVPVENTIYVGDRIDNDVKGALGAGMIPILKNAYTNRHKRTPKGVTAIDTISELPGVVEGLNKQG